MGWGRQGWVMLLCGWLCAAAMAQSVLEERLKRLPVSIGENSTVTRRVGESWVDIGIRERVGYEHLRRANPGGFASARRIFIPGRHQVAGLTDNGLVINLPELMNFRWANGRVVAWYPISIGRITARWRTPVGELRVVNRAKNPAWNRPSWAGGGVVPPGPRNPLGDRWIGLDRPGYGLHGTSDPTSIGRMVSHGCIRHFPPHIRQLYDEVSVGMPVIIIYQTVTVGQDDGIVYLAVFPDIYARGTNAPARVRQRLAFFRLEDVLTARELTQRLARPDGIARPLLGSKIQVTVNNEFLSTPIGPTLKRGTSYLPVRTIADAVGAQVAWDAATKTATLTRGDMQVSLPPNDGAFLALDTQFVPVRRAVEGLGGTVMFGPNGIEISIT